MAAQIEAYGIALEAHDIRDIEAAIRRFIRGEVDGHNQSFPPTASKLGSVVRECMNWRLDSERRQRKPELPAPEVILDPAARQRMIDLAKRTAAALRTPDAAEEAAALERKKAGWAKTNARFAPDMSDAAVKRRLGYSAGDPEDDAHAA